MVHIYFMPGMAASHTIFQNIKLPENEYKIHLLDWLAPQRNEGLQSYSKRICENIKHPNPVLVGVSFGGVIVQEISRLIEIKKLIIISSVKTHLEFPRRMRFAKKTFIFKLLPTSLVNHFDFLEKIIIWGKVRKRIKLYKKFIGVPDNYYMDWALEKIIMWEQEKPIEGIVHIHGDKDEIFPIKYIKNAIVVPGGTHIMIVNRYKWFNENLVKYISEGKKEKEELVKIGE